MSALRQAAFLNDEAVTLLSAGKYKGAMRAFELALVDIKMLIHANEFPQQLNLTVSLPSCTVNGSTAINNRHNNDRFYLYNHALRFDHGTTFCRENLAFYLSIVLFNMAVASHMESKKENDEHVLRRALGMYEMSFELADEVAIDSEHARQMMALMLNNKALIHYELGNYIEGKQDVELLSDIMLGLSCSECGLFIDNDIYREVNLNRFTMNQMLTAPSA